VRCAREVAVEIAHGRYGHRDLPLLLAILNGRSLDEGDGVPRDGADPPLAQKRLSPVLQQSVKTVNDVSSRDRLADPDSCAVRDDEPAPNRVGQPSPSASGVWPTMRSASKEERTEAFAPSRGLPPPASARRSRILAES
jgi:hypothetical protein